MKTEDKFHLYQSELRSKNIHRYKFVGMVTDILLSKDLFPKNEDLNVFLKDVFDLRYKDYVMKSRTTVLARCVRDLYLVEDKKFEQYRKQLFDYVKSDIAVKSTSSKNKDSFHKWMDGINE